MKSTRKHIFLALLLAVPITARPQSTIANRPAMTDRGHVEGLTYSNTTLGFSYQLPQGFFGNPLPDNLPSGSLLLMIADTHNGTPWRDRIVLIADDAGKYSSTTSEYVTHFVRSMPAKLRIVVLRETYPLKVTGQDFFGVDYQKTDEGKTVYQTFLCTRLKGSFVSWTFTSLNKKQLGQLAASVNTTVFAPPFSKDPTVANELSQAMVGEEITVHGKFSLNGKLGPYVTLDNHQVVYLIPRGSFAWGAPYSEIEGKLVAATGFLEFHKAPPFKTTKRVVARPPDHFYFDAEATKLRLIGP